MQPTSKYPINSTVEKLTSPLEVKGYWMYNEWNPHCQYSKLIQAKSPNQADLDPQNGTPALIDSVLEAIRGQFALWGTSRETSKWKKVVVENLDLNWVKDNIKVLYPTNDTFEVTILNGIVLWKDPTDQKYQLLEGNHRISAWLASSEPKQLPSILFIGKLKKTKF